VSEKAVVVMGLPESGKTTFLAALWHLVTEREIDTKLKFVTLRAGEVRHLNAIADIWRNAKKQERTGVDDGRIVSMTLQLESGQQVIVTFPDLAGESFLEMWERRECDVVVADMLKSTGVLLFVHADKITEPQWVIDEKLESEEAGLERGGDPIQAWDPRNSPTQVQLTDLLQTLQAEPLDVGARRLAVILSAWDKVEAEMLSPQDYLASKLPLLAQYLRNGLGAGWQVRIYGVSAQGGDYEDKVAKGDAERLRDMSVPSHRVRVIDGDSESRDLTEPLGWVLG